MTDEMIALARRAVACRGWRWMVGMRTVHDPEYGVTGVPQTWVLPVSDGGLIDVGQHYQRRGPFAAALGQCVPGGGLGTRLPDLTDPATLGCLLALVREAWGSNRCFVRRDPSWFMLCPTPPAEAARIGHGWSGPFTGDTEAEALVAALEASPTA